jgi:hypothetical protein
MQGEHIASSTESSFLLQLSLCKGKCWLIGWMVGRSVGDRLLLRADGNYGIGFDVFCYNRFHCDAVEEFWALWDDIYDYARVINLDLCRQF